MIDKAYCPIPTLEGRIKKVPSAFAARILSASERELSKSSHVFSSLSTSKSSSCNSKFPSRFWFDIQFCDSWLILAWFMPFFLSHLCKIKQKRSQWSQMFQFLILCKKNFGIVLTLCVFLYCGQVGRFQLWVCSFLAQGFYFGQFVVSNFRPPDFYCLLETLIGASVNRHLLKDCNIIGIYGIIVERKN